MDSVLLTLAYEYTEDARARSRIRACARWARDDLPRRGTLLDGHRFHLARFTFAHWRARAAAAQVRRRRGRAVVAWNAGGTRRTLHNDETPILPFG